MDFPVTSAASFVNCVFRESISICILEQHLSARSKRSLRSLTFCWQVWSLADKLLIASSIFVVRAVRVSLSSVRMSFSWCIRSSYFGPGLLSTPAISSSSPMIQVTRSEAWQVDKVCVCLCVLVYVCVCVCVCAEMYVYAYVFKCVYWCVCARVCVPMSF